MTNLIPKFQVEPATGKFKRTQRIWNPETKKFVANEVEMKRGYMAYLPNGACVHITSEAELSRLGMDEPPTLVDPDSGDEFAQPSLKSLALRHGPVTEVETK
jgi:hypothetical protein